MDAVQRPLERFVSTAEKPMPPANGVREGTARSRSGRATARRILDAARELLRTQGHARFSMRNVAEQAGLHLANVQYYYPRREDLIRAMLLDIGERYAAVYAAALADAPAEPEEQFRIVLEFNLQDIRERSTRQYFIQLWALLESHGGASGRLLRDLYVTDIQQLGERIAAMHPELPEAEIKQRATLLAAMIEGLMVVGASPDGSEEEWQQLMERAKLLGFAIANGIATGS